MAKRPFNQLPISPDLAKLKPFEGAAYMFHLLPVLEEGQQVFHPEDVSDLADLLTKDFGGCTVDEALHPFRSGTWPIRNEAGNVIRISKNRHIGFTVYTPVNDGCLEYFQKLELNLRRYLRKVRRRAEEKILIEVSSVRIL